MLCMTVRLYGVQMLPLSGRSLSAIESYGNIVDLNRGMRGIRGIGCNTCSRGPGPAVGKKVMVLQQLSEYQ